MATALKESESARIHRRLDHPVVDGDGHWLEPVPIFLEYLREIAGPDMVDSFIKARQDRSGKWYEVDAQERMRARITRPTWWGFPGTARDRATGMIPSLMYERLLDFGIDFALVYPTLGLLASSIQEGDLRRAFIRALNTMSAEMFQPYADRLTPVAVVPTYTPQEAIDEIEYVVKTLGMKAALLSGSVRRPIEADAEWQPDPSKRRHYIDCLAMDSPYDYDPLWAKFTELRVAVTTHSGSIGWSDRSSPTSFVANHLGHFAQSNHGFARALFLGGVTQRFPKLNFAFLEGGIGWACNLYSDIVGHWEKRNRPAMLKHLAPANVDTDEMRRLLEQHAKDRRFEGKIEAILEHDLDCFEPFKTQHELTQRDWEWDEFGAVNIATKAEARRLFAGNFYFGCEADDPITAWAFKDPTKLKPIFSSDISHFDVTDMTEVLEEAYELVEHGLIDEQNFREFTFTNAVKLHGRMNPQFFNGTAVEAAAARELSLSQGENEKGAS